jgi:hypothetical protein
MITKQYVFGWELSCEVHSKARMIFILVKSVDTDNTTCAMQQGKLTLIEKFIFYVLDTLQVRNCNN